LIKQRESDERNIVVLKSGWVVPKKTSLIVIEQLNDHRDFKTTNFRKMT